MLSPLTRSLSTTFPVVALYGNKDSSYVFVVFLSNGKQIK